MASGTSNYGENGGEEGRDTDSSTESEQHDRNTNQRVDKGGSKKQTNTDSDDGKEETTFSLTDPDALLKQLESVELTEEDTEELLHEAYKVNMKLKEMLRRQESKRRDRLSSAKSAYSTASSNSRKHQGPSVLPPIQKKSSANDIPDFKRRGDSSKKPKHPTSKSAKEKPAWDDRFSFS